MKITSGCLSDYEIRAMAANHDSAQSSVGNCTKESFLVDERNLLEVCAVAVGAAQVCPGNETGFCELRPNGEPITLARYIITSRLRMQSESQRRKQRATSLLLWSLYRGRGGHHDPQDCLVSPQWVRDPLVRRACRFHSVAHGKRFNGPLAPAYGALWFSRSLFLCRLSFGHLEAQ